MDQAVDPSSWGARPVDAAAQAGSVDPSSWGAKSAEEPPAKPKGFMAALTEGGIEGYIKESLPALLAQRYKDVQEARTKFDQNKEEEKEIARRQAAGESLNGMMQWKAKRLDEMVRETKGAPPPQSFGEIWEQTKNAVMDDPGGFVGRIARGLITNPELVVIPEVLPMVAVAAGESVLRQEVQTGRAGGQQTIFDTVMAAAPAAGVKALVPRTKAQVTMAADMAVSKAAKANGIEPSGELVQQAVAHVEKAVSDGQELLPAFKDALESVKVSPEAAADAAEMLKPEEAHAPQERKVPSDDQPQHIGADTSRVEAEVPQADRGNRPVLSKEVGPETQAGVEPKTEAQVIRPQQFQPLPKEVPQRFATADEARSIYEMAGIDAEAAANMADKPIAMGALRQRLTKFMGGQKFADNVLIDAARQGKFGNLEQGKVDPTLLKVLGLSAGAGAVYSLYSQDPKDAIKVALATGGTIAALAVLRKGISAVGEAANIWDKRYSIKHMTDEQKAAIGSAQLAHQRLKAQVQGLISNKKQREQLTFYLQGDESIQLTPEMKVAAKAVREFFDQWGDKGLKAGVLEQVRDQYVTQLWTGLNKNSSIFRNLMQALGKQNTFSGGMSPRSRFGLERVIPSYKEGMAKGLIPSTLDISEIMEIYGNNMATAIANKNFIAALKRDRMPGGERILGPADQIKKDITAAATRTKEQWKGEGPIVDDIRRFAESKLKDDYVLMQHPSLMGQVAHKDVAPALNALFDASTPNAAGKLAYGVSVAAKRGIFSFSFFHTTSLAQALLGAPLTTWPKLFEANRLLKQGAAGDVLDRLVRGGLKVVEKPLEGDVTPFSHALQLLYERHPIIGAPAKGVQMVQQGMNHFLWDVVQPTFKVATAMAALEKLEGKGLEAAKAAEGAASFSNDLFGGLDWYRIADAVQNRFGRDLALAVTSPSGRRWMQVLMLAPDWTVATARTFAKAIPGITSKEVAALHQGYIFKQAILYLTVMDGLNQHFSGHHIWQNQDPTMIDLGDGRKMQASKHMMEPIHWLISPGQQALNKLGYVVKEPLEQAFNKQYLSTKGAPPITTAKDSMLEGAGKRLQHATSATLPITGQQLMQSGAVPAISGFFGAPIYGKTDEQYVEAARQKAKDEGKDENKAADRAKKRRERAKKQEQQRLSQ